MFPNSFRLPFRVHVLTQISFLLGALAYAPFAMAATPITVTILHTNDLHSRFRPDTTPLKMGGVARLKTKLDEIRRESPASVLLDGGDWSEGSIYYHLGAGRETLRMMDHLGYDVAVVGNHDWLNGPDVLLDNILETKPSTAYVSANLSTKSYDRAEEFKKAVPPYVIKNVGGVEIAFIGLSTYQFIYDHFFAPVKLTEPFALTRELAAQLRKKVDAIVVISHNSIGMNEAILRAVPDADLVIGAHDHVKLTKPVVVSRSGGKESWVVETGSWGRYLGRVEMKVTPREPGERKQAAELLRYKLIQLDHTVPEDPETLARIERLEAALEGRYGPIFHDHVGESEAEMTRGGLNSPMGNFVTSSYLKATHADLALDNINFIYGEIHRGSQRTVDILNSNPAVYDVRTGKSWTVHLLPLKGKNLLWILNLLFANQKLGQLGLINVAGLNAIFDPLLLKARQSTGPSPTGEPWFSKGLSPVIDHATVGGEPLDPHRTYTAAIGGGILESVHFINGLFPGALPTEGLVDTGLEGWRVMADEIRNRGRTRFSDLDMYGRMQTSSADLGVFNDDLHAEILELNADSALARVNLTITNYGAKPAEENAASVELLFNRNGTDYTSDGVYSPLAPALTVPALQPGQSTTVSWTVRAPLHHGVLALTARLSPRYAEVATLNNEVTRWWTLKPSSPR